MLIYHHGTEMPGERGKKVLQGECDVVVIGGGPAGSTTAALLAKKGRRVVLLEKEQHPRFHIGESLLAANLPLFEKLGVAREVEAIGMYKPGATFVSPWHDQIAGFRFRDGVDKSLTHAYQVRRSEFDEILFRHAARCGADARERVRVREVNLGEDGSQPQVTATDADGRELTFKPRFIVDATGRDTLLGNRLKTKRKNPDHASAAIFGHFRNARRDEGEAAGNIIITWFEHGWYWFIPLKDGITSVGAVAWPYYMKSRKVPVRQFLLDTLALSPTLSERLKDAELVEEPTATGNYSYISDSCQGKNYIMVGDAFAFIDPMFSSGVMLAMNSAFEGVEVIEAKLRGDAAAEAKARSRFDWVMIHGPKQFSWFIYRVTNPNLRDIFMAPREDFGIRAAVISLLASDLFRGTPVRKGILGFRAIYYLTSLGDLKRSLSAWRRRAFNIRDDSDLPMQRG